MLGQRQPGWECWEENVAQLGCGGEGACWGGQGRCVPHWDVLSQALASVSAAVEMLTSSYSPEKNAARSQQLFLPGKQLPGGNLPSSRCLFAFSSLGGCRSCVHVLSRTLGVSLAVAAVSHPATPAPFLAQKGPGLLGCLGCSVLRWDAGHCQAGCSPASRRRSGFTALPDRGPWQVRGSLLLWERRRGLALPHPPQVLGQPGWAAGG